MILLIIAAVVLVVVLTVSGYLLYRKFNDIEGSYSALRKYNVDVTNKTGVVFQELSKTDLMLKGVDAELKFVDAELKSTDTKMTKSFEDGLRDMKTQVASEYVTKKDQGESITTKILKALNLTSDTIKSKEVHGEMMYGTTATFKGVTSESGKYKSFESDNAELKIVRGEEVDVTKLTSRQLKSDTGEFKKVTGAEGLYKDLNSEQATFNKVNAPVVSGETASFATVQGEQMNVANGLTFGKNNAWRWEADNTNDSLKLFSGTQKWPTISLTQEPNKIEIESDITIKGGATGFAFDANHFNPKEWLVFGDPERFMKDQNSTTLWGVLGNDKDKSLELWNVNDMNKPFMKYESTTPQAVHNVPNIFNKPLTVMEGSSEVFKTSNDNVTVKNLCVGKTCMNEADLTKLKELAK